MRPADSEKLGTGAGEGKLQKRLYLPEPQLPQSPLHIFIHQKGGLLCWLVGESVVCPKGVQQQGSWYCRAYSAARLSSWQRNASPGLSIAVRDRFSAVGPNRQTDKRPSLPTPKASADCVSRGVSFSHVAVYCHHYGLL